MSYPAHWPKASISRPKSVASRITEDQKNDLYHRRVTTRDLAKALGVNESYLSDLFPGKEEPGNRRKKELFAVRREFRAEQAKRVIAKQLTAEQAASVCNISYRSMARAVQLAKKVAKQAVEPPNEL